MRKQLAETKENPVSPITLADKINSPQRVKGTGSPRRPLTPLQVKLEKKLENGKGNGVARPLFMRITPIDGKSNGPPKFSLDKGKSSSTSSERNSPSPIEPIMNKDLESVKDKTKEVNDTGDQTGKADLDILTGGIAPLEYWKELAEQRRLALEEALKENQSLHERIEALEKENQSLEEMLEDAKTLAEMVNALSSEADDSGIVRDSTFNTSSD